MKRSAKSILSFILFVAAASVASAGPASVTEAEAEADADAKSIFAKQAILRGRVIDATGQSLPGASIYIESLNHGISSDIDGFYILSNIEPGTYTARVSYVGYSPLEIELTLVDNKVIERDIILSSAVELEEVEAIGVFQGQARAINMQRENLGVTNIVSSDQIGKFPDSNIGDALKRISGINVQYDQGEARFGQIRGTDAELSSVTINGNRIPSAEGETRSVQLDLIPAEMIQTIEVNKVITSDMDADAIGGAVNLVTKSSPYKRYITATAGTGYNWISDKMQLNLGLAYGDRFFDNKLGLTLAVSYQNAPIGSDNVEFTWEKDADGNPTITDYQIRQYFVTRERQSYSLSLDWDINSNNKLTFKGIVNIRNDWENRYRTNIKDIEDGQGTVRIQTKGGSSDYRDARLERQRTMDFTLGGEHLIGRLGVEWKLNYAEAIEERPEERYIDYQLKKQKFNLDLSDTRKPYLSAMDGYTMTLDDNFSLKEIDQSDEDITERDLKIKLDFNLPISKGAYGNKLKFGFKMVHKSKEKVIDYYEYTPIDEDAFNALALTNTADQTRSDFIPGSKYKVGTFVTKDFLGSLDLDDETQFEKESVQEELAENYKSQETVTAGYVRFDQKITRHWKLVAGVRLENTHVKYRGSEYDADEDITTTTPYESDNYINVLPSILAKWDVNEDLKVRASFTNTISRPKYSNLAPHIKIDNGDNTIEIGNPNLTPAISYNFDLSAEYYFKSIGLISGGIYYKRINDFIVDQTLQNVEYLGNTWDYFTQPRNSGNADIFGVEVAFQRDFGFIDPSLRCIGFYGNYTYTYSEVKNFNFEGREDESGLRMPGSPEHTANASLYFEKSGISVRLSYNYASSFIDEMGAEKFYDRYYDAVNYLDLNASYTFGTRFKTTIYAEATNLLNQPLRYYQGTKDYTMQSEHYGIKVNAGVKVAF